MGRGSWTQFPKLMGGFAVFALGISLMINADLGLDPWSAFHMGLSLALPLSYGMASAGAGLILLGIGAGFFSQKLDWGTVLNMLLIGF
ncbi:MAG TPA: membrane protein, partial [Deinococcales bacterium]|nr:membrane protein [Deinococcales bacterium]